MSNNQKSQTMENQSRDKAKTGQQQNEQEKFSGDSSHRQDSSQNWKTGSDKR